MHLPIIILLGVFSYQVWKTLKIKVFKYIFYAWVLNSFHVAFSFCKISTEKGTEFIPKGVTESAFMLILLLLLDLISSWLFLYASTNKNKQDSFRTTPFKFKMGLIFIAVFIVQLLDIISVLNIDYKISPFSFRNILPALLGFVSLISLYRFFKIDYFDKVKNKKWYKREGWFLVHGTLLYSVLQLLSIINFPEKQNQLMLTAIGYGVSLISKSMILYGLHRLFLEDAAIKLKYEKINTKLEHILGRTFHEITSPLASIERRLNDLNDADQAIYQITKPTRNIINAIELNYNRVIAVVTAAMKMYEFGNIEKDGFWKTPKSGEFGSNNINTLIEIAIINIKDILKEEENVEFIRDYGKNCNIICYPHKIIQVLINILKNSTDSFKHKGKIFIKTKIHNFQPDEELSPVKLLKIEIADNGKGISQENIHNVFKEGFTTNEGTGRGYGMKIVEELVEENQGKIEINSPYDFNSFNSSFKSGTKVTLHFPTI